ncbi:MAG: hypothetical protein HQL25_03845 [Candidatus Omnitrophica bacterium]|nr:hypothetical protein [Candidatus Omnitrophota bacterium]
MIYFLIGDKVDEKDAKLAEIKKSVLGTSIEAENFDYEMFYADDLDSDQLKKSLISISAVARQRVIVIKNIKKLNKALQETLLSCLDQKLDQVHLIFDCDGEPEKGAFWTKLMSGAKIFRFGAVEKKSSVFDMGNAILANNSVRALQLMEEILSEKGQDPLKMMGAVLWSWKNGRSRMAVEQYKKGLQYIQEADLNIKRSRLAPEYAMEFLIVKLCSLTAC